MMFKSKLATFAGALLLAGSSCAALENPGVCPSVNAIQAQGMSIAAEILNGFYLTYTLDNYDTDAQWVFMMGPVNATSEDDAIETGNQLLSTLSGNPTPEDAGQDTWACQYQIAPQETEMVAVALHAEDMMSPLRMSRFLRKHP